MGKYVVLVTNNDGGAPATIHDTFEAAKQAVREWVLGPESDTPLDDDEIRHMEADLLIADPSYVTQIRGSEAWKEWIYIAPLAE